MNQTLKNGGMFKSFRVVSCSDAIGLVAESAVFRQRQQSSQDLGVGSAFCLYITAPFPPASKDLSGTVGHISHFKTYALCQNKQPYVMLLDTLQVKKKKKKKSLTPIARKRETKLLHAPGAHSACLPWEWVGEEVFDKSCNFFLVISSSVSPALRRKRVYPAKF